MEGGGGSGTLAIVKSMKIVLANVYQTNQSTLVNERKFNALLLESGKFELKSKWQPEVATSKRKLPK